MIVYINYTVSMNKDTETNTHRQSYNVRIWVSNRAAYNNNNNNNNNNNSIQFFIIYVLNQQP
jgi:hypothetical protein